MMVSRGTFSRYFRVFASLCAAPAVALAQTLPDPTRPPPELSVMPAGQTAAVKDSVLQSTLVSPSRRVAIINGQTVELGAKQGEARLVEVSESGAVLEGPQGRQVLALFPNVEIKREEPPKGNDMKQATPKKKLVKKPASRRGKKERK